MGKKLKGTFWLASVVLILFVGIASQPVYGARSSRLKKDEDVRWLTKNICFYITLLNAQGDIVNGDKGTIQMTSIDRYNIATELAGGKYGKYISIDREDTITLSKKGRSFTYAPVDTGFANKLYKELFYKSMKVPDSQNSLVRAKFLNGHVYVLLGQLGNAFPSYSIKSITKVKKGIYKVKAEIGFRVVDAGFDGGVVKRYDRIGYTVVTLKKDNKAKHGYKVVKCSYRMLR